MRGREITICLFVFVLASLSDFATANATSPKAQELNELIGVIHRFYLGEDEDYGPIAFRIHTLRGSQRGLYRIFEDGHVSDYRFSGKRRRFVIRQAVMAFNPSLAVRLTEETSKDLNSLD